jgi:UMF1 family MFS transporter
MTSPAAAYHPADPDVPAANLRPVAKGAWALYDFANTIFSFVVISYAMGLWLVRPEQLGEANGQLAFSLAILISVGANAVVSPILGALSDRGGGRRLPYLLLFTVLCIGPTAAIAFAGTLVGLALFTVANFAYLSALIYYDATLKLVSTPATRGRMSGLGVGLGYCGTVFSGLLLFLFDIPVELRFVLAAVLYGLFAIPIFALVREPGASDAQRVRLRDFVDSWDQLRTTIGHARQVPGLSRFLLGRFFYSDAVNTVIVVMSIVAVKAVGFSERTTVLILLSLTLVAIAMSFVWGRLSDGIGPRRTLIAILASWAVGLILGSLSLGLNGTDPATGAPVPAMPGIALFLVAGAILGSGLGGVQVADRVFMIRLSPPERVGEFFGVYGLVGKASQVIGQLVFALIVFLLFDSFGTLAYQVAILSLIVTMLIGLWLVWPVSDSWAGSGELHRHGDSASVDTPPARLAPDRAPLEDRS